MSLRTDWCVQAIAENRNISASRTGPAFGTTRATNEQADKRKGEERKKVNETTLSRWQPLKYLSTALARVQFLSQGPDNYVQFSVVTGSNYYRIGF